MLSSNTPLWKSLSVVVAVFELLLSTLQDDLSAVVDVLGLPSLPL